MFGTHHSSYPVGEGRGTRTAFDPILKEFILNEEGFLSSKYSGILKKYYSRDFAEKLYVFHGTLIRYASLFTTFPRVEDDIKFYSTCWDASRLDDLYSVGLSPYFVNTYESARGRQLPSVDSVGARLIRQSIRHITHDYVGSASISEMFHTMLPALDRLSGNPGGELTGTVRDLAEEVRPELLNLLHACHGNELGIISFNRRTDRRLLVVRPRHQTQAQGYSPNPENWLAGNNYQGAEEPTQPPAIGEMCGINLSDFYRTVENTVAPIGQTHTKALGLYGTASALQAFFHKEDISGYDGPRILSEISV